LVFILLTVLLFTTALLIRVPSAELVSLRNQSIMCLGLVNFMWIILIMTLLSATQLDVLQTNIPGKPQRGLDSVYIG